MPGLLVRVRTGLLIPDGSVRFQSMAELLSDEADAWSGGGTGKIEEDHYASKKELVYLAMYLFVHICLHESNSTAPKPKSEAT